MKYVLAIVTSCICLTGCASDVGWVKFRNTNIPLKEAQKHCASHIQRIPICRDIIQTSPGDRLSYARTDYTGICAVELADCMHTKGYDLPKKSKDKEKPEEPKDKPQPIHIAAESGETATVQALLAKGAKIDLPDTKGRTALHISVEYGNPAIVQLLLDKGAKVDLQDNDGETPLHDAARFGEKAMVQLLLDKGAKIDLQDKWGQTALYIAASYGEGEIVQVLLDKGAKVDLPDIRGRTALGVAETEDIAQRLKAAGAK